MQPVPYTLYWVYVDTQTIIAAYQSWSEPDEFIDWPELFADGAVDDEVDGGVEGEEEVVDLDQDEEHHRDVEALLLSAPAGCKFNQFLRKYH